MDTIRQVELAQFLRCRSNPGIDKASESLMKKAAHLADTYPCFSQSGGASTSHFAPNRWRTARADGNRNEPAYRNHNNDPPRTEVVRIGNRELSRENLARKDFLVLMNKITMHNQGQMLQTLKNVFRDDCLDTYLSVAWDAMQRSPDFLDIYMDVLRVIEGLLGAPHIWREKWLKLWDSYLATEGWAPAPELLKQNTTDYDEFCDFVKWKKRSLAALQAWATLERASWVQGALQQLVPLILQRCTTCMSKTLGNIETDVYLDQVISLIPRMSPEVRQVLHDWFKTWEARLGELKPSTRFKMFDIRDHFEVKMKPKKVGRR